MLQTGIYVTPAARRPQDMRGLTFPLEFEIIDKRESTLAHVHLDEKEPQAGANAPYKVKALLTVRRPTQPPGTHSAAMCAGKMRRQC